MIPLSLRLLWQKKREFAGDVTSDPVFLVENREEIMKSAPIHTKESCIGQQQLVFFCSVSQQFDLFSVFFLLFSLIFSPPNTSCAYVFAGLCFRMSCSLVCFDLNALYLCLRTAVIEGCFGNDSDVLESSSLYGG